MVFNVSLFLNTGKARGKHGEVRGAVFEARGKHGESTGKHGASILSQKHIFLLKNIYFDLKKTMFNQNRRFLFKNIDFDLKTMICYQKPKFCLIFNKKRRFLLNFVKFGWRSARGVKMVLVNPLRARFCPDGVFC